MGKNENGEKDCKPLISVAAGTENYALSTHPDGFFQDSQWPTEGIFIGNTARDHDLLVEKYREEHTKEGVFDANGDGLGDVLSEYQYDYQEARDTKPGTFSVGYYTREIFLSAQRQKAASESK